MNDYILIISNNKHTLNVVFKQVGSAYKLLIASTSDEVNELLTDQEYEIAVVLVDEGCIETTSLDTLKHLQKISYLPHYIPLLSERDPELVTQLMLQGAFDCLVKPLSETDMHIKIEAAFRMQNLYDKMLKEVARADMKVKEKMVFQGLLHEQMMKQRLKADILDIQDTVDFVAMVQNHASSGAHFEGEKLKERVRGSLLGKSQAKILIIEDEVEYQNYLHALLSPMHEVFIANNAVDGIHLVSSLPDLDIVLLDVRMPYMDGVDAILPLRKKCPDAPIIMLTASDDTDTIIRALQDGAYDYCIKPIIPEQLLSRVGQCLEEKFYPKVMDEMIKEIKMKHISDERRIHLLHELCLKRKTEGKMIGVSEILIFFPQLNTGSIGGMQSLHPDALLAVGISNFVYSLKELSI